MHIPVLLKEVIQYLNPKPNQNFIDATVGDGGHAAAILEKTSPKGKLLAIDRDLNSIIRAKNNLAEFENRVLFINDSFGNLEKIVRANNFGLSDGILFDFGMSTSQLENSGKGFTFTKDEILDMRYDVKMSITAEDIVNEYSDEKLEEIFKKWGEEPKARLVAREIVKSRKDKRIKTTKELVKIVERVIRRHGKLHSATLIFQALRIEVNQELVEIEKALKIIPKILNKNGKAAFISFHSLEDRLIKNWARDLNKKSPQSLADKQVSSAKGKIRQGWGIKIITKKPVTASDEELKINRRSRSAKLRVVKKI